MFPKGKTYAPDTAQISYTEGRLLNTPKTKLRIHIHVSPTCGHYMCNPHVCGCKAQCSRSPGHEERQCNCPSSHIHKVLNLKLILLQLDNHSHCLIFHSSITAYIITEYLVFYDNIKHKTNSIRDNQF